MRSVAFFDVTGRPLRGHGPVPLPAIASLIRQTLHSLSTGAVNSGDVIVSIGPTEYAAVLLLRPGEGVLSSASPGTHFLRDVTGACVLTFGAPSGTPIPAPETVRAQLAPALTCVGRELAFQALVTAKSKQGTAELDWLFNVSAAATLRDGSGTDELDCREQVRRVIGASIEHFGCELGAVLIPERNVRLVHTVTNDFEDSAKLALRNLEGPLLDWVRRKNAPMLVNHGNTAGHVQQTLRVLAVPITTRAEVPDGALVLLRSNERTEFRAGHLALARNLSRHIVNLLATEIDPATGLYTRAGAQHRIDGREERRTGSATGHSVICVKIDQLHVINETSGFSSGDALIVGLARLLQQPHVPADSVAARISGNEFALVLRNADTDVAERAALALQQHTAQLSGQPGKVQEPVSLSCGVAPFKGPSEFQRGLALAALACRTAKARGRGRIETYQDTDVSMIRRQTDVVAVQQLREALREDRFTLFAQSIVPLQRENEGGGYELLLRLADTLPENRAPTRLLAAALQNQLAPDLDLWVIEHAVLQALPYRSELLAAKASLSINITGPSLTDEKFLDRVRALIRRCGLTPALITFEITEQVAVLSLTKAMTFVRELRSLGCRFALDDFGTGANSLKNLTNLPVDRVKIDGSFVSDILTNPQSEAMVRAIVGLARDLDIATVAEYAEDKRILERLRKLGVQYAQGYAIDKPRALADVLRELRAHQNAQDSDLSAQFK
ncbi:MAG: EAL domain-containing protein [Steroidobacteraceae bacterium]